MRPSMDKLDYRHEIDDEDDDEDDPEIDPGQEDCPEVLSELEPEVLSTLHTKNFSSKLDFF